MAAERVSLDVRMREERGSAAMRRMRKEGLVPGVVYGGEAEPTAIAVADRELRKALMTDHGLNAIMDVTLDGQTRPVILKEFQVEPIKGRILHADERHFLDLLQTVDEHLSKGALAGPLRHIKLHACTLDELPSVRPGLDSAARS